MSQEERSFPLFKTLFGPCPGEVKIWGHLLVFFCSWNCFASRVGIGIPMVMQGGRGGGRARSIVLCSSVLGKSPFICTFTRVQSLRYDKGRRTVSCRQHWHVRSGPLLQVSCRLLPYLLRASLGMKKLTIVVITGGLLWVFVVSSKGYLASISSPKMLAKKVKRVLCLRALISVTFYCCSLLSLSYCIFVWFARCSVIVKAWKRRKLYKLLKGPGWWVWSCMGGGGGDLLHCCLIGTDAEVLFFCRPV